MTTKAEKTHLSKLASLGCVACRLDGYSDTPAEIHHVRDSMGMSRRASHFDAIPLCPAHHRGTAGKQVPSIHGSKLAFESRYGTERMLLNYTLDLLS